MANKTLLEKSRESGRTASAFAFLTLALAFVAYEFRNNGIGVPIAEVSLAAISGTIALWYLSKSFEQNDEATV